MKCYKFFFVATNKYVPKSFFLLNLDIGLFIFYVFAQEHTNFGIKVSAKYKQMA